VVEMKINKIVEIPKYNDHSDLKEKCEYKKSGTNSENEQLSFSEILKRERNRKYLNSRN
jgi:hypothetical protein